MIKHIVCHSILNADDARCAAAMLNALMGRVPSLMSMNAGVDVLHAERSYELGIVAEFKTLADLADYDVHPEHMKVKRFIASVKNEAKPSVAVDFEF